MNLQGKVSQGIPIGNDVSFLLAELVLAQVDRSLKLNAHHGYRWYDDYEVACSSRQEAEEVLARLTRLLETFKLRLNPLKTQILDLPLPSGDSWQDDLLSLSKHSLSGANGMVSYFDHAFRLRQAHPEHPVLMYAIGVLFKLRQPDAAVQRVAESCISQAILSEPGCAQKAFALLSYWEVNGAPFDRGLAAKTVETLSVLHESRGLSSDIAWALAFAIQNTMTLSKRVGASLSRLEDDAVAIQCFHAHSLNLLPAFNGRAIERALRGEHCDGDHWLLLYEGVRKGYLVSLNATVRANTFMSQLLSSKVSFYRTEMPAYAMLLHPGGAPEWVVSAWLKGIAGPTVTPPTPTLLAADLTEVATTDKTVMDVVRELLHKFSKRSPAPAELYE